MGEARKRRRQVVEVLWDSPAIFLAWIARIRAAQNQSALRLSLIVINNL
jgi:hypothetical protein